MIRFVPEVLLFLLPFAAYAGWLWASGRGWKLPEHWHGVPLIVLMAVGIVLVAVSLFLGSYAGRSEIGGTYVPAHMENGKLVPGRTVPASP